MLSNAFEAISLEEREAKRKKSGDRGRRNEVCKGTRLCRYSGGCLLYLHCIMESETRKIRRFPSRATFVKSILNVEKMSDKVSPCNAGNASQSCTGGGRGGV